MTGHSRSSQNAAVNAAANVSFGSILFAARADGEVSGEHGMNRE
jgi:hypothetical protein